MSQGADRLYEQLLVLRCQAHDDAAFDELVARYHLRLRLYVRKMIGSGLRNVQHSVEDVVQDVWLATFAGLGRLRDPGAFAAWLYQVARNRVFQVVRAARDATAISDRHLEELAASAQEPRFEAEDVLRLYAALDLLSPEHREVLLLKFIEQMSYEQMAQVTGASLGTVRSRLHYAKLALKQILERNQHEGRTTRQGAAEV